MSLASNRAVVTLKVDVELASQAVWVLRAAVRKTCSLQLLTLDLSQLLWMLDPVVSEWVE